MFFIVQSDERPDGWVALSTSNNWVPWLSANIPTTLAEAVRARLKSNLKHILVGLELKAALVQPHHEQPGVLFEPYYQSLISEFCVAAFSVFEGLGAAHWLNNMGQDGGDGPAIGSQQWQQALCQVYDPNGEYGLAHTVETTRNVRNRLHQDRLGMRESIDWHAFSYDTSFEPAIRAVRTLLLSEAALVPASSNLP